MLKGNAARLARRLSAIRRTKPVNNRSSPAAGAAAGAQIFSKTRKPLRSIAVGLRSIAVAAAQKSGPKFRKQQVIIPRDHPNVPIDEAKSLAQGVINILKDHQQLTSEQLWEVVKQRGEIHSKRYMKRLLRWMKAEKLVCTELPDKLAENRVFKVGSEIETNSGCDELVSRLVNSASRRVKELPPHPATLREDLSVWSRFAARPPIPRDVLRCKSNEELRGRAPLMPVWDI